MPTPFNHELVQFESKPYSGMELIYFCIFKVDLYNDPDVKPVTIWKKDDVEITSDSRLTVIPPKYNNDPSGGTFNARLKFNYLTLGDEGNYTCDTFVNSSLDNEFIRRGNLSLTLKPNHLSVEGTLTIIIQTRFYIILLAYIHVHKADII